MGGRPRADGVNGPWAMAMLATYCWTNCWLTVLEVAAQILFFLSFCLFILLSRYNNGTCFSLLLDCLTVKHSYSTIYFRFYIVLG